MKKITYLSIIVLCSLAVFLFLKHRNNKCHYPVFDLNYKGQVVSACLQSSSIIHHKHQNSDMIEVVSPSARAQGETFYFEGKQEMAEFVCQILFRPQGKRPSLYDLSAASPLPNTQTIRARNQTLSAANSDQSPIINLLFCMTGK